MRRSPRTLLTFAAVAMLAAGVLPLTSVAAAPGTVTGTLSTKAKIALTPTAVAVITLVDQQASADARVIVGQQRVDAAVLPLTFAVPYDAGAIDPAHSYALYASVVDGATTLQTFDPVPVITGGPTEGVVLTAATPPSGATMPGTITRTDKQALTPAAVAYATLVNQTTGTMIARQVIPSPGAAPIAFAIPFDPGVIDPAATYVAKAAIVDGSSTWEGREDTPAIVGGTPVANVTVPVTLVGVSPASPAPSVTAAPSVKPTAAPTAAPTAPPTAAPTPPPTVAPTTPPTAAPTAPPTAAPTPSPTAAPTASPTPAPTVTPSASPSAAPTPTPIPDTGTIRGTLTWNEEHEPTADARALVILVEGSAGPTAGTIVASTHIVDPGAKPIPFELAYPWSSIKADTTYRLYAGLVDGDLAWVTPIGVTVKVPAPLIEDLELPLAFRPDLLKAAVSGSLNGLGLDPARDPESYATAILIRVDTGETIGFQLIEPLGAAPIPFSVPYDPTTLDPNADYVARGSVWDGTILWATPVGVPVITKDNAKANVSLTVTEAIDTTPTPAPSPAPTASPAPGDGSGGGALDIGTLIVVLVLAGIGAGVVFAVRRSRS